MDNRFGCCVVLFNPDESTYHNVSEYSCYFEHVVAVDNSIEKKQNAEMIKKIPNVIYLDMEGNSGIAKALNKGFEVLIDKGCKYVLTMDQDSKFPVAHMEKIQDQVLHYIKEYAIVGLNFNYESNNNSNEIVEIDYWLTSGNFVDVEAFKKVNGFNSNLFIDYVDIEFNYKLHKLGMKICYLKNYSLKHKIGNPIKIKLFGKCYYAMNHNPIRYYYRYRNSRYLFAKDKKVFLKLYLKEIVVNIPKMLLYEDRKKEKLRMIKRGISDAKHNKLGEYMDS